MKNVTRKLAVLAFCLTIIASSVFAYSKDDVIVNYLGSYSRYNFNKEWSNADNIAESLSGDMNLTNFYRITEDNIDKEDYNVRDFAEKNLASYDTSDNNVYMSIIKRNEKKDSYDGWIIITHCSASEGFYDYIFYFAAK